MTSTAKEINREEHNRRAREDCQKNLEKFRQQGRERYIKKQIELGLPIRKKGRPKKSDSEEIAKKKLAIKREPKAKSIAKDKKVSIMKVAKLFDIEVEVLISVAKDVFPDGRQFTKGFTQSELRQIERNIRYRNENPEMYEHRSNESVDQHFKDRVSRHVKYSVRRFGISNECIKFLFRKGKKFFSIPESY